jgi:S-adenosylmethionine decarboxylase
MLGWHWFADFRDCGALPTSPESIEAILVEAARLSGATVVQSCFHQFSPYGLSGVVVIAESHLAAHTWPEHRAMCVDIFSCSDSIKAELAIGYIQTEVRALDVSVRHVERGGPMSFQSSQPSFEHTKRQE